MSNINELKQRTTWTWKYKRCHRLQIRYGFILDHAALLSISNIRKWSRMVANMEAPLIRMALFYSKRIEFICDRTEWMYQSKLKSVVLWWTCIHSIYIKDVCILLIYGYKPLLQSCVEHTMPFAIALMHSRARSRSRTWAISLPLSFFDGCFFVIGPFNDTLPYVFAPQLHSIWWYKSSSSIIYMLSTVFGDSLHVVHIVMCHTSQMHLVHNT